MRIWKNLSVSRLYALLTSARGAYRPFRGAATRHQTAGSRPQRWLCLFFRQLFASYKNNPNWPGGSWKQHYAATAIAPKFRWTALGLWSRCGPSFRSMAHFGSYFYAWKTRYSRTALPWMDCCVEVQLQHYWQQQQQQEQEQRQLQSHCHWEGKCCWSGSGRELPRMRPVADTVEADVGLAWPSWSSAAARVQNFAVMLRSVFWLAVGFWSMSRRQILGAASPCGWWRERNDKEGWSYWSEDEGAVSIKLDSTLQMTACVWITRCKDCFRW